MDGVYILVPMEDTREGLTDKLYCRKARGSGTVSKRLLSSGDYLHLRGIQSGENLHTATIRADRCEILLLPRQVIPTNPVILYQKQATMQ
jgi:hypothetical protein